MHDRTAEARRSRRSGASQAGKPYLFCSKVLFRTEIYQNLHNTSHFQIVDSLMQEPMQSEDAPPSILPVFALRIADERLLGATVMLLSELSVVPKVIKTTEEASGDASFDGLDGQPLRGRRTVPCEAQRHCRQGWGDMYVSITRTDKCKDLTDLNAFSRICNSLPELDQARRRR